MKKLIPVAVIVLVLVGALALPVSNLVVGLPNSEALAAIETDDPAFAEARDIMGAKCANCHTQDYILPFYANFPVAQGIIEADIQMGLAYMDMPAVFAPAAGGPVDEVTLAKIEYTLDHYTMPPKRYLALHWDGGLSTAEREAVDAWIDATRVAHYAPEEAPDAVKTQALHPIPSEHGQDPVKAALGDTLYHDVRLSGDDTLSCASCHDLARGGTDQIDVSVGIGGALGPINSPTVFNARYNLAQFWDGRAANLREQAEGPVENPIEMGATFEDVIAKLNADGALRAEFEKVYPEGFTKQTITDAIAEFERTLITPNSRFDQYLAGDADALSADERAGYEVFTESGCAMCHVGKAMGGQSYELMGRKADYFADRGGEVTEADLGRFNHTGNEADRHRFKVPLLRNIEVTYPYFHDASAETMAESVEVMAEYQMGVTLSPRELEQVVAFLRTLTGELNGEPLS